MTVQLLLLLAMMLGVLALIVAVLQGLWSSARASAAIKDRVRQRLRSEVAGQGDQTAKVDMGPIQKTLVRAGFTMSSGRAVALSAVMLGLIVGVGLSRGWIEAMIGLFFVISTGITLWRVKFEKLRKQVLEDVPVVLDSVLRSITAGRSIEQALLAAFGDASPVFQPLLQRLRSAINQGRDYTPVFEGFANMYRIPALTQIAIALRTTSRFGSSIKPVLQEVSKAIRSQQELRREFMAATAETRFTAVVFAVMPPGLAAYMVILNEEFSAVLLNTDTGHTLLMIAGALQVIGSLLIWNLIRRVGRD
ncbi:type II secretion system F family protein [Marinobacter sp. HL-58]|uniref:type II secretion system F family protein n=1 Tax=Marinobacter sp. HL-58 TaxID=1479237 RepID=UPI00048259BF|nr:type II secretion system F family protein [Marinobacter sp. HL-58]KPP97807.1 MAG: Tad secretion system assembly platform protein TadB [Marinobacter sp. HL-58]